jgi:sugar O-acyltransferase (sialic acid O-acetyltransferase NeuD family)
MNPFAPPPPFIIVGAGGHASVVVGMLRAMNAAIRGLTDRDEALAGSLVMRAPILGDDNALEAFDPDSICLANGLGVSPKMRGLAQPDPGTGPRRRIFEKLAAAGFAFPPLVHPSCVVADAAEIGRGAQIMAGAILQPRAVLRENSVVNSAASVDHDCWVGAHAFIAPGAVLCGGVHVGAGAMVGAGVVILPGVSIGENAVIGAGAVIRRDVASHSFAV